MSCLFPLKRYRLKSGALVSEGKALLQKNDPPTGNLWLPCGQCGECRLSRARMWATRCTHEAQSWKLNSFITLTYREPPPGNSLNPQDTRDFIRRVRYSLNTPFKYFLVGEYGDQNCRPHYHALIFGHDFGLEKKRDPERPETSVYAINKTEALRSSELDELWGLGHTSVGELTFDSAAYCAQYAMKKVNGSRAKEHYQGRYPEFMRCSNEGIGKKYANQFADEIILHNGVMSNGTKQPIPAYYLKQFEKAQRDLSTLKQQREDFSQDHSLEKSYVRACKLDSKFKLKISKQDAFRVRYAKDLYYDT